MSHRPGDEWRVNDHAVKGPMQGGGDGIQLVEVILAIVWILTPLLVQIKYP
jgi:hypothetical protein